MTRILLIGRNGQVGWELFNALSRIAVVSAPSRAELDITNFQDVLKFCEKERPDFVINATGYNDVDGAETNESEANSVNVKANACMASAACQVNAFYITYSTDYVFDGLKNSPYTEKDPPNPINTYGRTKFDGEAAVMDNTPDFLILRTSSVFSLRRPCFLSNFLRRAQEDSSVQVRSDLISSPTSAAYLASITTQIAGLGRGQLFDKTGLYHLAGAGAASRFEWSQEICDILNLKVMISPVTNSAYHTVADRPIYSALDSSKFYNTFNIKPTSWKKMLKATLEGSA